MDLADHRRFYAEEIRILSNITSPALVEAFATVPREKFLGPAPWHLASQADFVPGSDRTKPKYRTTSDSHDVYHNILIALDPARGINNGEPAFLATCINAMDIKPGDQVLHVGCGVGYYTAIMAEVAGPTGKVTACEVDPPLAARAKENLSNYPNVTVHETDGATFDPGKCDAIFINAGATHPLPLWLNALTESGRLIVPLTTPIGESIGAGLIAKITKRFGTLPAQIISTVAIYNCTSARNPEIEPLLTEALNNQRLLKLQQIRQDTHEPDESCAVHTNNNLCLSTAPIGQS